MDLIISTKEGYEVISKEGFGRWLLWFYGQDKSKTLTIKEAILLQKREI
jgi:hypothetical protein